MTGLLVRFDIRDEMWIEITSCPLPSHSAYRRENSSPAGGLEAGCVFFSRSMA